MNSYTIPDSVLSKTIGEEEVLVDLNTGTYFGLNEIGTIMWSYLKKKISFEQMHEEILNHYEVSAEKINLDFQDLLKKLSEKNLINIMP